MCVYSCIQPHNRKQHLTLKHLLSRFKTQQIFSGWQGLSAWYSSPSRLERSSRPRHHRQRHRRLYCRMHQITATTMTLVYLPWETLHWCQKMCNYWICQFNYCRQNRKAGRAQKVRKTWQLGPEKKQPSLFVWKGILQSKAAAKVAGQALK